MSILTMPGRADALAGRASSGHRLDRTLARRLLARLVHALPVRQSAAALERLDERMLRDIGLRRSGLRYVTHADCEGGL